MTAGAPTCSARSPQHPTDRSPKTRLIRTGVALSSGYIPLLHAAIADPARHSGFSGFARQDEPFDRTKCGLSIEPKRDGILESGLQAHKCAEMGHLAKFKDNNDFM